MINSKSELKRILKKEKCLYNLTFWQNIMGLFNLSERGIIWKYQKRLRTYEYHLNTKHRLRALIFHFLKNKIGLRYGLIIEPNAVDEGMRLCHLGSVLIRGRVGKDATIHINTALVGGGTIDQAPICGDNLYLSIGATVVGPVTIGDDVCIGAGAVVTKDVESHKTVAGVPAKVIADRGPLSWK